MLSDVRPSADAAARAQLPLVGMHGFGMRDFGSERTEEGEAKFDRAREDFSNFEQLSTAPKSGSIVIPLQQNRERDIW